MTTAIVVLRERAARVMNRTGLLAAFVGLGMAASGCATGAYPIDIFPEMHYQQSFRSQEGPRLDGPQGSVPALSSYPSGQVVKSEVPVDLGTGLNLKNPMPKDQKSLEAGQRLYDVNCGPCHGGAGKGDGALKPYFEAAGPQVPVDLTGPRGTAWSEGQLYAIITNGQPPGYFENPGARMPAFGRLLTPDERWLIVMAVQRIQGR